MIMLELSKRLILKKYFITCSGLINPDDRSAPAG